MGKLSEAKVAVLMGGRSSERDVSLTSGREIAAALRAATGGPREVREVEVLPSGAWLLAGEPRAPGAALDAAADVDLWFLGLHGGEGEDGTVQGLLKVSDRAFTGSDVGPSALCMDKVAARDLAAHRGVAVAPGAVLRPGDGEAAVDAAIDAVLATGSAAGPGSSGRAIAKPRHGGSSVDTLLSEDRGAVRAAVLRGLGRGEEMLVEAGVDGVEATVPVLGNRGGPLRALTPVEIRPKPGRFFDYEEKYTEGGALELVPPERLDQKTQEHLRLLALALHDGFRLDGYSRIDFLVPAGAQPVLLEVNTLPGMTPRSLFPKSAAHDGIPFPELCCEIARLGLAACRRSRPGAVSA